VSTDPTAAPEGPGAAAGQPSEEELRAAYEAELSRITSADMMLQAAVSLLNIGSYRLAPPPAVAAGAAPQRPAAADLAQVRDAIDGVRALLEILERTIPSELGPLRDALSQLQMAYAREVQASAGQPTDDAVKGAPQAGAPGASEPAPAGAEPGRAGGGTEGGAQPDESGQQKPGPAESSGRLWVPGR
jgi:hypothetical protein